MKLALKIVLAIALLSFALYFFTTDFDRPPARVTTPWQIEVLGPDRLRVMDVVLGEATLEQLRQRFGQVEGLALFRNPDGRYSLEAYLGKVRIGPFSGRWIVTLDASPQEMEALSRRSVQRIKTGNGSIRWTLEPQAKAEQANRVVTTLTMIPDYSGMDAEFLRSRFGKPGSIVAIDEKSEQWIYPDRGLRILLDREGKEMFEYMPPMMMRDDKQPSAHIGRNEEQKP
jgi:hypothetical protein